MAHEEITKISVGEEDDDREQRSLRSLLADEGRDYLVRNNGEKVKICDLKGKIVGLYFSASWCGACRRFTPILVEAYTDLLSRGSNFEIVFVSSDEDDEDFDEYFAEMPWLAIPFFEEEKRVSLGEEFGIRGIPTLVILDENGAFLSDEAARAVRDYGAEGFPFTAEKIEKLEEEMEAARLNQNIKSLLVTNSRDFLVTSNFKKVPVSELEGKIVGLYFTLSSFEACAGFTRRLVSVYNDLKGRGENFEIVLVSLEEDESSFMDDFEDMPWLGIPFRDKLCEKLVQYFELADLPTLVVIGANGKTVNANAAELVEDYGVDAYPFNSKKVKELRKKEKARIESQTLESLLISGDKDYLIKNDNTKVPVVDLVGKNILLFFSAHWCPPGRVLCPRLIQIYNEIKERDGAFEVILISSDEDEESFNEYFSQMPWLAIPFWDDRSRFLTRVFKITGIPSCVAISPEGKTVTKEARNLIMEHGADAYPFTQEQIRKLTTETEEKAKLWPEKIRHKSHSHVLWKNRRMYICDGCGKTGKHWSFYCKQCDFDLHPHCALDGGHDIVDSEEDDDEEEWPEKIKHMLHKHVLVKAWRHYECDACGAVKHGLSYFCEACDFDLHPGCAFGKDSMFKVMDNSSEESDGIEEGEEDDEGYNDSDTSTDKEDVYYDKNEGNEVEHESPDSLHFKKALELEDEEGEEAEDESKKIIDDESGDNEGGEDTAKDNENEEDSEGDDELEDGDDGPEMKGYVCNTRERDGLEAFQESIFTCKLQK